ncbi:Uncharacterised protein [Chlamydia trachomatis]|nr:Uncharacterised protein [Chlamydia trachomatis]
MSRVVEPVRPVRSDSVRITNCSSGRTKPCPACAVVTATEPASTGVSISSRRLARTPASAIIVRIRRAGPGPSVVMTIRQPCDASCFKSALADTKSPLYERTSRAPMLIRVGDATTAFVSSASASEVSSPSASASSGGGSVVNSHQARSSDFQMSS